MFSDNSLPLITRLDDRTYEYRNVKTLKSSNFQIKIRIELPSDAHSNLPQMKKLTQRMIKQAEDNHEALNAFTYVDKKTGGKWKISKKRDSFIDKICAFLFKKNLVRLVHPGESPAIETYQLRKVQSIWDFFMSIYSLLFSKNEKSTKFLEPKKLANSNDFNALAAYAYQNLEEDFVCHDQSAGLGLDQLFEDKSLEKFSESFSSSEMVNAIEQQEYTSISSHPAFTSNCIFIYKENQLHLIHQRDKQKYKDEAKEAITRCLDKYWRDYGWEKMDYAQHLGGFNLEKMRNSFTGNDFQPLTPEHIYRLNILTSGVEHQDIQSMASKIAWLNQRTASDEDGSLKLGELLDKILHDSKIWSDREKRSLKESVARFFLNKKQPTDVDLNDFRGYCDNLGLKWDLQNQLQFTRSAVLAEGPQQSASLEEFLDKNLQGLWKGEQKKALLAFVGAFDKPDVPQTDLFLKATQYITLLARSIRENDYQKPLRNWLDEQFRAIRPKDLKNGSAAENLCRLLPTCDTVADFHVAFKDLSLQLAAEQYDRLAGIFRLDGKQLEQIYTGRKILRPLDSAYTQADVTRYKPWVDMQEFLQASEQLSEECLIDPYTGQERFLTQKEKQRRFDEIAAFLLCKKHLFRPHPREGYRVGEIIPAPSDEQGNRRWYVVARMVAGHDGLMNYVLEPVGWDSRLSTHIVSRSTSSDPYSYGWEATLKNDANPLRDPGYLGRRHTDKYLESVKQKHTIPAWVAYQYAAQTASDPERKEKNLLRAVKELQKEVHQKHHQKNLHEIVSEFDAEINDLMGKRLGTLRMLNSTWIFKYTPLILLRFIFKHYTNELDYLEKVVKREARERTRQKIEGEAVEEKEKRVVNERKDALKLLRYIWKYAAKDSSGQLEPKYQELVNILGDHLYRTHKGGIENQYVDKLKKYGYDDTRGGWIEQFDQANRAVDEVVKACNKSKNLEGWEQCLLEYAIKIGEDVDTKSKNGLKFSGHSLGGSIAQVDAYLATAGANRLPVPGSSLDVALYDDPGMAEEDNLSQYEFMLNHAEVMRTLNSSVNVYHSHEYGDIIPLGATAHLGGVTPELIELVAKRDDFKAWLEKQENASSPKIMAEKFITETLRTTFHVETQLKQAMPYAMEPEVGDYPYIHGTRYEMARREQTQLLEIVNYVETEALSIDLEKNLGVLNNFLANVFSFPPEDCERFKKKYAGIYDDPRACVRKLAPNKNGDKFLAFEEQLSRGERLVSKDLEEFERLKKSEIGRVYAQANQLQNQRKILSALRKTFVGSVAGPQEAVNEILKFLHIKSHDQLLAKYRTHLEIIQYLYNQQLTAEAQVVRARARGGVRVTWLDRSVLGQVSRCNIRDETAIAKIYGLGIIFTSSRSKWLREYSGEVLLPAFQPRFYDEDAREKMLCAGGHGEARKFRNEQSNALVIDAFGGYLPGLS